MKDDDVSVVPVFIYWIQKNVASWTLSAQLQLELDVLNSLTVLENKSFSSKNLRQIEKMSFLDNSAPFEHRNEFEIYQKVDQIVTRLNSMTESEVLQFAASPAMVKFVSFLTTDEKTQNDIDNITDDINNMVFDTNVSVESIHPLLYAFQCCQEIV